MKINECVAREGILDDDMLCLKFPFVGSQLYSNQKGTVTANFE